MRFFDCVSCSGTGIGRLVAMTATVMTISSCGIESLLPNPILRPNEKMGDYIEVEQIDRATCQIPMLTFMGKLLESKARAPVAMVSTKKLPQTTLQQPDMDADITGNSFTAQTSGIRPGTTDYFDLIVTLTDDSRITVGQAKGTMPRCPVSTNKPR